MRPSGCRGEATWRCPDGWWYPGSDGGRGMRTQLWCQQDAQVMSRRGPLPTYLPSPQVRELISGRTSSERNLHSRSAQHLASSEDHQRQVGDLRNGRSEDWGMGGVTIRGRVLEETAEVDVDDLPSRPVLTRRVERTDLRPSTAAWFPGPGPNSSPPFNAGTAAAGVSSRGREPG